TAEYERVREYHKADRAQQKFIPLTQARENAGVLPDAVVKEPAFTGSMTFNDYSLEEIAEYIDWSPFFHSWEMKGSYPRILDDADRGAEAKKLFADAQAMLKKIIEEKWLTAKAVFGIYPAVRIQDDILVYEDKDLKEQLCTFHTLRQQTLKPS